jgi:hypothetical protein
VGSRLSFCLKVTADDGFLSRLRPLDRERPVRLADDAIGGFHPASMTSLAGSAFHPGRAGESLLFVAALPETAVLVAAAMRQAA